MHPLDAAWHGYILWAEAVRRTDADGNRTRSGVSTQSMLSDVMENKMLIVESEARKHAAEKQIQAAQSASTQDDPVQAVIDDLDDDLDKVEDAENSDFDTEAYINRIENSADAILFREFASKVLPASDDTYYAKVVNIRFSTIDVFQELLDYNENHLRPHYFCRVDNGYFVPKQVSFVEGQRKKYKRYVNAATTNRDSTTADVRIIFHYTEQL